ncbi:MAG: hypothetical protein GY941_11035 [Planctomycetes bacterium]|nr:hypothetical protein [Planctomycetota bacterium]
MKNLLIIVFILFSANISFAGAIQDKIREAAQRKYPDDNETQQYEHGSQYSAYWYMQAVSDKEVQSIATHEYPNDYSLQRYVYDEQLSAKQYMQTVEDREIREIAMRVYPNDYSLQRYIYNNQLSAKIHVIKVDNSKKKSKTTDGYDNVKIIDDKATQEQKLLR